MYRTIILLVLALALSAPVASAAGATAISGRVVDEETGKGVNEVEVRADLGPREFRAVTDHEGRYTIKGLEPGAYRLSFHSPSKQHVLPVRPQLEVRVAKGKAVAAPDLALPHAGAVRGIVLTDKDGGLRPLPKATIDFMIPEPRPAWGLSSGSAQTNYKGTFAFNGLPAARELLITVKVNGHTDLRKSVPLAKGKRIDDLRFVVSWSDRTGISGGARNAVNNQMLKGVSILLKDGTGEFIGRAVTDDYGEYSLVGVAPGTYEVVGAWEGRKPLSQKVVVEAGRSSTVVFDFTP